MSLRIAVDFGTSSTCVATAVDGGEPQVVVIDGAPVVSSAVYGAKDGTLFIGREAERQAAIDPSRYEPNPKRRIGEGELLLGDTVFPVLDVVRGVLARAVGEARRIAGGAPVDLLVLTHPVDWGATRSRVLRQAGRDLAGELVLVPEPVAAAVFHTASHAVPMGAAIAVLDVGGGTVDVSVVRRERDPAGLPDRGGRAGFHVLATSGDPNFGGADIDQLLLARVGREVAGHDLDSWRKLTEGRDLADHRRRRVLVADVRSAKETLSRHTYTDVPLPPPFPDVHVTRPDFERLISDQLSRVAEVTATCIDQAGLRPGQLAAVFLVGGTSRIPLVARLVQQRIGVLPTTLDQPETVVARGALRAVALDPVHAGGLAPRRTAPPLADLGPPVRSMPHVPARSVPPDVPDAPPGLSGPGQRTAGAPGVPPPGQPRRTGGSTAKRHRLFRPVVWWIGGVVLAAGITVTLILVLKSGAGHGGERKITQYHYSFSVPRGWAQTGDTPGERKVEIDPAGDRSGSNSITVQEFALASTSRDAHAAQLRAELGKRGVRDVNTDASFAGKEVVYYREKPARGTIDWYVLFDGTVQVSVGCEYTDLGATQVRAGCQQVIATMAIVH